MTGMVPPSPGSLLLVAYLLAGVAIAAWLERRGMPTGAVLGSVVAWPLLLPLLGGERQRLPSAARGARADRIDQALDTLLDTLADPAAASVGWDDDLTELRASLHHLDARLALVDRLLEEEPGAPSAPALRRASEEARRDIDAVLAEVSELRLQVGLMALAGDGARVRERLQELSGRARALDEIRTLTTESPVRD